MTVLEGRSGFVNPYSVAPQLRRTPLGRIRTDHISNHTIRISPRDLADPSRHFIRALKGRLGHYARPEGRDEPFRARVFAEPGALRLRQT